MIYQFIEAIQKGYNVPKFNNNCPFKLYNARKKIKLKYIYYTYDLRYAHALKKITDKDKKENVQSLFNIFILNKNITTQQHIYTLFVGKLKVAQIITYILLNNTYIENKIDTI